VNDYDFLTTLLDDGYIYLQTIAQTSQNILSPTAFCKVISGVLEHVSRCIVESFLSEDVKRFNVFAVMGIDADLRKLEDFADENYQSSVQDRVPEAQPLKSFIAKARQIVNLFLATQPELYLDPTIRERNYYALDPKDISSLARSLRTYWRKCLVGGLEEALLLQRR
jgi:hypothetical protein